ncbi:hypothetical protein, partial [Providencia huaxiensis]
YPAITSLVGEFSPTFLSDDELVMQAPIFILYLFLFSSLCHFYFDCTSNHININDIKIIITN